MKPKKVFFILENIEMFLSDNFLDLTSAIMDIYLDRLNERQRRKDICREYQLVDKFFAKNNGDNEMKKHER